MASPPPIPLAVFDMGEMSERHRPPVWHEQLDRRVEHIERDLKFAKKIGTAILVGVAMLVVKDFWGLLTKRPAEPIPMAHYERMGVDRVPPPEPNP